jgi:hypothetical protein
VGIIVGTTLHFCFGENALEMELGLHELVDALCGLVEGLHTHIESPNFYVEVTWGFYSTF